MKSHPIYKEEYNVYLVEADDKIYRVQIYFKVSRADVHLRSDKKEVINVKEFYVEEIFKFNKGGEKK